MAGVYEKGHLGVSFLRGSMCAEGMGCGRRWVLQGIGTASGHPGVCVDYLSRQFVPKWDSPNSEGELATARTASLLVELECVAA